MASPIDLRSDTITKPTPEMRRAMADADVGDDVYGEDPTVRALEERAAEVTGKGASMYVPSGTMGNACAVLTHATAGQSAIMDAECHIYVYEQGGVSALGGILPLLTNNDSGLPTPEEVQGHLDRPAWLHPAVGVVCVENTHNRRGGSVAVPADLEAVHSVTSAAGVPLHMDGARVFNAATFLGVGIVDITQHVDSVQFCLSKGLCAPVGSILAGSEEFIARARATRRRLGGAMRQAGVIAAAGLIALNDMPARLHDDHENARHLAEELSQIDALGADPEAVQTNIVIVRTDGIGVAAGEVVERLRGRGVLASLYGPTMLRFVTNRDATRDQVKEASAITLRLFEEIIEERKGTAP
ncbi:threonine aldolase [Candidatus Poribacteria bacterium]|nr:threonine aldolase [Candidatus Poribacteria bacterium]